MAFSKRHQFPLHEIWQGSVTARSTNLTDRDFEQPRELWMIMQRDGAGDQFFTWPHDKYPLRTIGRLTLNENPHNYFQDIEQAAFSPSNMVPGIGPSADMVLQARMFSYPDSQR